jgi:SAM-dependent methyltransferase
VQSFVKVDKWLRDILVDPLDKTPLITELSSLISQYGRRYQIINGIFDLRLLTQHVGTIGELWKEGQDAYEDWCRTLIENDNRQNYVAEREGVRDVYEAIPVVGRCIDIGGHQGRLRAYIATEQEYVSVDPYIQVFDHLNSQTNLLEAYPCLKKPVNFVCAFAEHLPFTGGAFDTAHMRSCIDHFVNPELAVLEAHRVLKPGGQLIIGLSVEGGRIGRLRPSDVVKEMARRTLSLVTDAFQDHHVWHPTYIELCRLIEGCGFKIEKTYWQRSLDDRVCYVKAVRS